MFPLKAPQSLSEVGLRTTEDGMFVVVPFACVVAVVVLWTTGLFAQQTQHSLLAVEQLNCAMKEGWVHVVRLPSRLTVSLCSMD